MRAPRLLAAALLALAMAAAACTSAPTPQGGGLPAKTRSALQLDGTWNWQKQPGPLDLGVTHTQNSLDPDEPGDAKQRGSDILSQSGSVWQNNHLMGFGTLNPEPAPGEFDWDSLDQRMKLVKDTGGRTVLTLCCAPDWMKGGEAGQTDWSRLEKAPDPQNFDDFADLAAKAVQRYPQVERVLVWNELKGFYNDDQNRWDYEGYTALYNKVYKAVKAVRPEVEIGGPYAVLSSLNPGSDGSSSLSGPWGVADQKALDILDYWLANNVGADFIAVDSSTATRQKTLPSSVEVGAQKFADLAAWIHKRTPLPIWWAEFYPDVPKGANGGASSPASTAATLATVAAFARSGASTALLWGPRAAAAWRSPRCGPTAATPAAGSRPR